MEANRSMFAGAEVLVINLAEKLNRFFSEFENVCGGEVLKIYRVKTKVMRSRP